MTSLRTTPAWSAFQWWRTRCVVTFSQPETWRACESKEGTMSTLAVATPIPHFARSLFSPTLFGLCILGIAVGVRPSEPVPPTAMTQQANCIWV